MKGASGRPLHLTARFARQRRGGRVVYFWSFCRDHVSSKHLGRRRNEWVLYAYIIEKNGGEASLEHIRDKLARWKNKTTSSRTISKRITMNKKKGFEKIGEAWVERSGGMKRFVSIYSFKGSLPEIDRATLKRWDEKLSPKGDNPDS